MLESRSIPPCAAEWPLRYTALLPPRYYTHTRSRDEQLAVTRHLLINGNRASVEHAPSWRFEIAVRRFVSVLLLVGFGALLFAGVAFSPVSVPGTLLCLCMTVLALLILNDSYGGETAIVSDSSATIGAVSPLRSRTALEVPRAEITAYVDEELRNGTRWCQVVVSSEEGRTVIGRGLSRADAERLVAFLGPAGHTGGRTQRCIRQHAVPRSASGATGVSSASFRLFSRVLRLSAHPLCVTRSHHETIYTRSNSACGSWTPRLQWVPVTPGRAEAGCDCFRRTRRRG